VVRNWNSLTENESVTLTSNNSFVNFGFRDDNNELVMIGSESIGQSASSTPARSLTPTTPQSDGNLTEKSKKKKEETFNHFKLARDSR